MRPTLGVRAALALALAAAGGCALDGRIGTTAQAVTVCPETVTPDDRGDPRNASGQIRQCWPGEANCYCDQDNDCYATEGYVACTPPSSGDSGTTASTDSGTTASSDAGTTTSTDSGPPPPPPPPPPPSGGTDVLPAFDSATVAHVRDLVSRGAQRGNAHDVVAKIGDSITESASFLMDCGHGWYDLGSHGDLEPTIRYFSMRTLPGGEDSLARSSLCATAGWTAADALEGGDPRSPLARELDAIRPQWAIVMYGTNDLDRVDVSTFAANMGRIVDLIESRAAVTVLSTIPPRRDGQVPASRVGPFNDAVRGVANARHLPLIDYWLALQPLPSYGISSDGIHPNVLHGSDACIFTDEGLRYGYNVRGFTALGMLARLRGY